MVMGEVLYFPSPKILDSPPNVVSDLVTATLHQFELIFTKNALTAFEILYPNNKIQQMTFSLLAL